MTSEITEEMVERLVEQAAHLELGIACRGPDVSNAARELLSQLNAVLPGLRALAARPIEAGSVVERLKTWGAPKKDNARKLMSEAANIIQSKDAAIAERDERIRELENLCMDLEQRR